MALTPDTLQRVGSGAKVGTKTYGVYHYITEDAVAAVATNAYFDALAERFTEGVGDIIHVVHTAAGVAGLRSYLVTRTAGDIAITAAA